MVLSGNNKRVVTTASELSLAEHLAVLDEATELPPFGFNIAGLEQRLGRRLGFDINQVPCVCVRQSNRGHDFSPRGPGRVFGVQQTRVLFFLRALLYVSIE